MIAADRPSDTATNFSDYRSRYVATLGIITTRDVSFRDGAIISAENEPLRNFNKRTRDPIILA